MKEIKKYVNEIFKNITMNDDLKLQKTELYDHLVDKVIDLINEGLDEPSAITKVIDDMGSVNDVKKELNLDDDPLTKKIKRLKQMNFYTIYISLIGLESFILLRHFLPNSLTGFIIMLLCVITSLILFTHTILQVSELNPTKDLSQLISFRKVNIGCMSVSIGVFALILPYLTPIFSFLDYLKMVVIYLTLAFILMNFIIKILNKQLYSNINLNQTKDILKHKIVRIIKDYLYIPLFLYLLIVVSHNNDSLFYITLFISILFHVIYDLIQSHYERNGFNLYLIRVLFTLLILGSIGYEVIQYQFELTDDFLPYIMIPMILALFIVILVRIVIYVNQFRKMNYEEFIQKIALILTTVIYTISFMIIVSSHHLIMSNTSITFELNTIVAKSVLIFYIFIDLIIRLIIKYLLNKPQKSTTKDVDLVDKSRLNMNRFKSKKSFILLIVIVIIIVVMTLKIPHYFIYKSNVQSTFDDARVTQFKYDVYHASNGDDIVLTSYKLSDGRYCIGYQQYFTMLGPLKGALSHNYSCEDEVITKDTISSHYSVTMDRENHLKPTHHITLYAFGHNSGQYKELVITYDWGQVLHIPINDDPLFFYYLEIDVPSDYNMDLFWGNDFFIEEKILK